MSQPVSVELSESQPYVYIVVLNWNGCKDTLECLGSIEKITYRNFDVIVADNGSEDGSVEAIRSKYEGVEVLENGFNLGFADGNNRAIEKVLACDPEYILLLNNDTVVDKELISSFVDTAVSRPGAGIFGAKIYHYDQPDVLWYAGGYWDQTSLSFCEYGCGEFDNGQYDTCQTTDWIIGCAMFIRTKVFKEIGLLESTFFLNNEEIDFCLRAKKAGFSLVYAPRAILWHKISVSFGGDASPLKEYFSARNRLLLAKRAFSPTIRWKVYFRSISAVLDKYFYPFFGSRVNGRFSLKKWWWSIRESTYDPLNRAYVMGVRDFLFNRFGNCPEEVRNLNKAWVSSRSK